MAGMRERGTSFLTELRDFVVKGNAVGLATVVSGGAAFRASDSSSVDDALMSVRGRIFDSADFSNLFVVLSNRISASVPSLTSATDAAFVTLNHGVPTNAKASQRAVANSWS